VFENVELEVRPAEANLDFIKRFIPKLEWDALVQTARSIGEDSLPEQMPGDKETLENEEFLQKLHHVLMEVSGRWTGHNNCYNTAAWGAHDLRLLSSPKDSRRRRPDEVPWVRTHLSHLYRDPQHGQSEKSLFLPSY
jgi:hypothetical protein